MADAAVLVPLLFAVPLVAAALTRLPVVHRTRVGPDLVAAVGAGATTVLAIVVTRAAAGGTVVHHLGGWQPVDGLVLGIPLVADAVAAGFVALASALVTAALVHLAAAGARGGGLTHVLTLVLLGAVNGFVLAGDLFTMAVFIELLGITVYAVTAGKTDDPAALPAAVNLAVVTAVGAALLLLGVGLFHDSVGTPNLAGGAVALAGAPTTSRVALAGALITAGLAVKAGVFPFHFAHADVHTATTVQHAGLFGAVILPVGAYGILRVETVTGLAPVDAGTLRPIVVAVGVATALVGGVMALCQDQLKRLLAFSSISHLGVVVAVVGLLTAEATAAASLYVLGHAPVKLALLLTAGLLLHQVATVHVRDLVGRAREVPTATVLLAAGGLALAGTPPSGLFGGKAALGDAAEAVGLYPVVPLLYAAAILTGAAVLRVVVHLVTGWPVPDDPIGHVAEHHGEPASRTPWPLVTVPAVLLLAGIVVPLVPGVLEALPAAGVQFHDAAGYVGAVLDGAPAAPGSPDPLEVWSRVGLTRGVLAGLTAGLGGLAVARWRGRRRPGLLGAPVRWLRLAHRSHVGDQTAWLSIGVAVWCGAAVLAVTG